MPANMDETKGFHPMANALNVVATPGDGDAPNNSVPVTLWGAGSGGGGSVDASDVQTDITAGALAPLPWNDLETALNGISTVIGSINEAVTDLTGRVEALEANAGAV